VQDSGVRRFKVTSANKVGILPKPDIEAEVKDYLKPGTLLAIRSLREGRGRISSFPPPNMKI